MHCHSVWDMLPGYIGPILETTAYKIGVVEVGCDIKANGLYLAKS